MAKDICDKMAVARQIRKARERLQVPVEQMAQIMGWSRPKLMQVEKGQVGISCLEIARLGEVFGVSLNYFFSEDEMPEDRNSLMEERRRRFGQSIRRMRFHLQKSLAEMADHVHCSPAKWLRIEQGKTEFSATELKELADWFEVSPDYFFVPDNDWLKNISVPNVSVGQK
jgi:transcriptional regulator with XRE-family HTH domain